jgi:hypothetical protein
MTMGKFQGKMDGARLDTRTVAAAILAAVEPGLSAFAARQSAALARRRPARRKESQASPSTWNFGKPAPGHAHPGGKDAALYVRQGCPTLQWRGCQVAPNKK